MTEQPLEAMVPVWAMHLNSDLATIKARTEVLPEMQRKLEALTSDTVPRQEHDDLRRRVDQLWDVHNTSLGELQARKRWETVWRAGLSIAYGALALWVAAHQAGLHLIF